MRAKVLICLCLFLTGAVNATAQVTARQGEPSPKDEIHRFKSPMILDLPLTVVDESLWGQGQVRSDTEVSLRRYICDGVSFADFAVSARRQRAKQVKLTFDFTLANEPGIDKFAGATFTVMAGDAAISTAVLLDSQVEEGRRTVRQVSLVVPEEELRRAPPPTLRIVLRVKVDE